MKGPSLKDTRYFINEPALAQWVNDVGEFKRYNVLVFNQMIKTMDHMLRISSDLKKGVHFCAENLDMIQDLKTLSLNQFQLLLIISVSQSCVAS